MGIIKTPTTLISNATVAASSSNTSASSLDLSGAIDFAIGYTLIFNAGTNNGARIDLFGDPTGANSSFSVGTYDRPIDSGDVPLTNPDTGVSDAGHTVSGVIPFNRSAKYVKARIVNLGNQSITGAYIYGIVQAQG